jgi:hypothetical protein
LIFNWWAEVLNFSPHFKEKVKVDKEDIKDIMGKFHNEVIECVQKYKLTIPQTYLVLDMIKRELIKSAEKIYINREK